jgi:hypothetical protein
MGSYSQGGYPFVCKHMEKSCLRCGKSFKTKPSHFEIRKFCSTFCRGQNDSSKIPVPKIGEKKNRLTVTSHLGKGKSGHFIITAKCDCGNEVELTKNRFFYGTTKSCGCLQKEVARKHLYKHGMVKTRPWVIWSGIISRCSQKFNTVYKYYGGRGITYDKKWSTFQGFWDDMKDGYSNDLEIDRIDNGGNYTKENCRWTTRLENNNNTRVTRYLTVDGETLSVHEWQKKTGVNKKVINDRFRRGVPEKYCVQKWKARNLKKHIEIVAKSS